MEDRFLRGRQIAFMIYEYFWVTGAHEAVLDFSDLFHVALNGDDIQDFDTRWDQALLQHVKHPKRRIRESDQLQKYWPCTIKKSVMIDRSRFIRS